MVTFLQVNPPILVEYKIKSSVRNRDEVEATHLEAILFSELSSPLYLKTTTGPPTSCAGCPALLLASCLRYLLRHTSRREDSVVVLCC